MTWWELGHRTYPEYLATRHWRELTDRLIRNNRRARCWICRRENTLLLHHIRYDHMGEEKQGRDVYILCFHCHERVHFPLLHKPPPFSPWPMRRRMLWLRMTFCVRTFRIGSLINLIGSCMVNL